MRVTSDKKFVLNFLASRWVVITSEQAVFTLHFFRPVWNLSWNLEWRLTSDNTIINKTLRLPTSNNNGSVVTAPECCKLFPVYLLPRIQHDHNVHSSITASSGNNLPHTRQSTETIQTNLPTQDRPVATKNNVTNKTRDTTSENSKKFTNEELLLVENFKTTLTTGQKHDTRQLQKAKNVRN